MRNAVAWAIVATMLLTGAAVARQRDYRIQAEECASGVSATDVPMAGDGKAVRVAPGKAVTLRVPVGAGIWRLALSIQAEGANDATLVVRSEDQVLGRHYAPAGAWGSATIGVQSTEDGEFEIDLSASGAPILVDTVDASELAASKRSRPLTKAGKIVRETPVLKGGKARVRLVLPVDAAMRQAAQEFAAAFRDKTGATLDTLDEAKMTKKDWRAGPAIMVGNLMSGPWSLRLYQRRLIYSDADYPGKGGHELRVVHDPWAAGHNVIYLGGTDATGAAAAGAALLAKLDGTDVTLEPMIDWTSERTNYKGVSDEGIANSVKRMEDLLTSFRSLRQYQTGCGRLASPAIAYYLSGNESYVRQYAALLEVLVKHYKKERSHPPTFVIDRIVSSIDQIEEAPGFDDKHRLMAGEWLRKMVDDSFAFWELRAPIQREEAGVLGPAWNHETHPAIGVVYAVEYLRAHYNITQSAYWKRVVDNLFRGQSLSYKPLEDSSNYEWITLYHTAMWALVSGEMQFFENGNLRKAAELALACHDNFFNESTFGDAWMSFGSNALRLMEPAALYYRDPRYLFLVDKLSDKFSDRVGAFALKGEPEVPEDHVGLRTFILDPAVHKKYTVGKVPAEKSLDKAVFRGGWTEPDQYLMLDGMRAGIHGHQDANAIIRFCDNGRLWLVDMDYIKATSKWHNTVAIARDGETDLKQPPLAELVGSVAAESSAIVRSRLPGYAGADWTRTIFWQAEDFFVVIDEIEAKEAGHYRTQCTWRTLGDVTLNGSRVDVEQDGERFHIVNADGSRQILRETWDRGHGGDRGYYAKYPHADKITKTIYQNHAMEAKAGDTIRYANAFCTDSAEWPRNLATFAIDRKRFVLSRKASGKERNGGLALVGTDHWKTSDIEIAADAYMFTSRWMGMVNARRVRIPGLSFDSETPAALSVTLPDGKAWVDGVKTNVNVDAAKTSRWIDTFHRRVKWNPQEVATKPEKREFPRTLTSPWQAELGSPVEATDFWSGKNGMYSAIALDDGRTVLLDAKGKTLWESKADAMVRAVAFVDLDGDGKPEIASGADDAKLRVWDLTGKPLWDVEIQKYHGRSGSVASVCGADLDGDGDDEVVMGSDNMHHYAFDGAGKELWRTRTVHASTVCDAADLDGDGRDEVLAGTEYYGSSLLDEKGKAVAKVSGGPNWPLVRAMDVTGDGQPEAIFGADDSGVRVVSGHGGGVWTADVGGAPTGAALMPKGASTAVALSSEAFVVAGYTSDGTRVWWLELPEQATDLASVKAGVAASCDDGTVYVISPEGKIVAGYRAEGQPDHLAASGDGAALIGAWGSRVVMLDTGK